MTVYSAFRVGLGTQLNRMVKFLCDHPGEHMSICPLHVCKSTCVKFLSDQITEISAVGQNKNRFTGEFLAVKSVLAVLTFQVQFEQAGILKL